MTWVHLPLMAFAITEAIPVLAGKDTAEDWARPVYNSCPVVCRSASHCKGVCWQCRHQWTPVNWVFFKYGCVNDKRNCLAPTITFSVQC